MANKKRKRANLGGRTRKFNVARKPCGEVANNPSAIGATDELLARRVALVGNGDPALSTNALDILKARGWIDHVQHQAGANFKRDYLLAVGRVTPAHGDGARGYDGEQSDDERRRRERAQHNVGLVRSACPSYNAYKRVRNICIYDDAPVAGLMVGQPEKTETHSREMVEANTLLAEMGEIYCLTTRARAA